MTEDKRSGEQPRRDTGSRWPGPPDEASGIAPDGLTEDELRWVSGGTQPSEDEPFLPG